MNKRKFETNPWREILKRLSENPTRAETMELRDALDDQGVSAGWYPALDAWGPLGETVVGQPEYDRNKAAALVWPMDSMGRSSLKYKGDR